MAISKIKSDSVDSIAATKLTGTVDNARITLDAAEIPNLDAAKITTGDVALARLGNAPATDLTPIRQDLAMLALYNAVSDNRAAYNLPNSFIDQFEDDTGVTTQTDVDNVDEYFASVSTTAGNDSYTKLLLHMDDTGLSANAGTSVAAITKSGSITRSSTQSKFGGYSAYNSGGAGLHVAYNADWGAWASQNVTVDFWFRLNALGHNQAFVSGETDGQYFGMRYVGNLNLNTVNASWTDFPGTKTNYAINTWYHVAIVQNGTNISTYVDGVLDNSRTTSGAYTTGSRLSIFGDWGGGNTWYPAGYIDEFRLSLGIARFTSNFTPPTAAYGSVVSNATGTLISDTQTASSATTKMSGVILYKDHAGTATLGTDLVISLSANGGTNYTEAASYGTVTPLFSTGVKMVRLGETTVTSGTAPVIKAVWANQASGSKETQLHGWAMNY